MRVLFNFAIFFIFLLKQKKCNQDWYNLNFARLNLYALFRIPVLVNKILS